MISIFLMILCITAATSESHIGPFDVFLGAANRLATPENRIEISSCAHQCMQQFKANINRDLPSFDLSVPKHPCEYDAQQLNTFCTALDTTYGCIADCPNPAVTKKGLDVLKYICQDSTMRNNLRCLNDAYNDTRALCEQPARCGQYADKIDEFKETPPSTVEKLKDMMKQTCLRIQCNDECKKPSVIRKCGESAQADIEGFGRKSVEYMKFVLDTTGLSKAYAPECNRPSRF